jgi:predicted nucleic acid-binding protein
MTGPVIVLDSGVLDLVTSNPRFRAVLSDLIRRGYDPIVPTVVLAEAVTGLPVDAPTNLMVRRFGTTTTPEAVARQAGRLRHAVARHGGRRLPSGIDAIVAAHAADAGAGVVFTTDPTDLGRLLEESPRVSVVRP